MGVRGVGCRKVAEGRIRAPECSAQRCEGEGGPAVTGGEQEAVAAEGDSVFGIKVWLGLWKAFE